MTDALMPPMSHDALQEDLASHLRGNTDRMVWTNIPMGPVHCPRPDVFSMNKSYSRFRTDIYEVKVSVSDLRSDVTSGKWQSYRKFAHAVWFAFPRGMAPLDLVPKECGVILRSESGWRAARKPVAQVLDTLPRDAWIKLVIESQPTDFHGRAIEPPKASAWHVANALKQRYGKDVAELFQSRQDAKSRFESATRAIEQSVVDIRDEIAKRRQDALKSAEKERERLTGAMADLAGLLGLPQDQATAEALTSRISSLRWKLHRGGLDDAIKTLESLKAIVLNPVPSVSPLEESTHA